jgi:hypothetical protein
VLNVGAHIRIAAGSKPMERVRLARIVLRLAGIIVRLPATAKCTSGKAPEPGQIELQAVTEPAADPAHEFIGT